MSLRYSSIAFAAGVIAHVGFFKRGERFLYPFRYVQALLIAAAIGTVTIIQNKGSSPGAAFREVRGYIGLFLAGLYTSLLIYRLFLNPLNSFPGPFSARITKFGTVFRNVKFDSYLQLHKLHKKYGKFVRIGPNDLSVIDADAINVVSAPNSKCVKSSWYQQDTPFISLHTTSDRVLHDRRRRVWSPAFSDKALRRYEDRIHVYNDLFIEKVTELNGQSMNASKWFNLYSFEIMSELAFSNTLGMLKSGETHWAIKLLGEGMDPLGLAFPAWFFRTLVAIPGLAGGYHKFIDFCSQQLDKRMKMQEKHDGSDIIHTLIDQYNASENKALALSYLRGDSRLIIVAGSDTTAAAFVHIFYWLAKKPEIQTRLREELRGRTKYQDLMNIDVLNGIINEALRLNPPVPSGVFRQTPPEGVKIGNTYVPGNTVIQVPHYSIGHEKDIFADCESFVPERHYSKPDMIKHKDAFIPFSSGPFGCIGKNLAYMELRGLTAQVINKFDVKFAPGETGEKLLQKSRDHFTLDLADLNLVFTKRSK